MTKKTYLVVGAGLSGSVYANLCAESGIDVVVIDKNSYIGGAIYDEYDEKHKCFKQVYGPHIFHTTNKEVWDYITRFSFFNDYIHYVKAVVKNKSYNFPINYETLSDVFNTCITDNETAKTIIEEDIKNNCKVDLTKDNFETTCIKMVGPTIYNMFFKDYTEKQWQMPCTEIPSSLLKRVPFRYSRNNTYFEAPYQGMPMNGYTSLIDGLLSHKNISIKLNTDFFKLSKKELKKYDKIIFTGDFSDKIPYRSTKFIFKSEKSNAKKHFVHPVVNLPKHKKYTRRSDYNLLCGKNTDDKHLVCYEKPSSINKHNKLYPIDSGIEIYEKEKEKFEKKYGEFNIVFLGRLAEYKYFDMDKAIENALNKFKQNEEQD